MPRYFQYMISPKYGEVSTMISIRVDDSTITCYFTMTEPGILNKIPLLGQYLPGHKKTTAYVMNQCFNEYMTNSTREGMGVHANKLSLDFQGHDALHADSSEADVFAYYAHSHLEHDHRITVKTLEKFLISLKHCEANNTLPDNEKLLTAKVCKDIINSYKEFNSNPDYYTYVTSNNPNYSSQVPSVGEHYAGILSGNPTFCVENPALPLSTTCVPPRTTPLLMRSDVGFLGTVGCAFLLARKLGLFGRTQQAVKPEEPKPAHTRQHKLNKSS